MVRRQAEGTTQRVGELPAAGIPAGWFLGQRTGEDAIGRGRDILSPAGQRRRRLGQMGVHHREDLIAGEYRHAGQQLERGTCQRVLIRPAVHRPALDLLRRRVARRTQEMPGPGQPERQHTLAQPEVRQIHMVGAPRPHVQQHVRRFHIAVHQSRGVRGVQRRRHRGDDGRSLGRRQQARTAQQRTHVPARHVTHRDEQDPAGLTGLVHRDDVRILNRRGRLRLPDKPAPEILIGRQRRAEDLQRDQAVQPLITRPEHHRHPARTHLLLQQVPGNPRARSKTGQHTAGLPAQPLTHPPLHGREPPNSGPGHPRDNNQPLPGPTPQWNSKYPGHPPPPQPNSTGGPPSLVAIP